jgi:hypothetical protein
MANSGPTTQAISLGAGGRKWGKGGGEGEVGEVGEVELEVERAGGGAGAGVGATDCSSATALGDANANAIAVARRGAVRIGVANKQVPYRRLVGRRASIFGASTAKRTQKSALPRERPFAPLQIESA